MEFFHSVNGTILMVREEAAINRVTRLGDFLPFGRLFTWGSIPKNAQVCSLNFGANYFHGDSYTLLWTKMGLLTNPSGHPGPTRDQTRGPSDHRCYYARTKKCATEHQTLKTSSSENCEHVFLLKNNNLVIGEKILI
jgi:hypothetical protein